MSDPQGFVVAGRRLAPDWLDCTAWPECPELRLPRGSGFVERPAGADAGVIVLTAARAVDGQAVRPGYGQADPIAQRLPRFRMRHLEQTGCHLVVDVDGRVFQRADLVTEATRQLGTPLDDRAVVVMLATDHAGLLYDEALADAVELVDWLTAVLAIQRVVPHRYTGCIERLERGGQDYRGVAGARDCSRRRGPGDPGDAMINRLGRAGYEPMNLALTADRDEWRRRQRRHKLPDDGIPDVRFAGKLRRAGRAAGMWVPRPMDEATDGLRYSDGSAVGG